MNLSLISAHVGLGSSTFRGKERDFILVSSRSSAGALIGDTVN